MKIIFKKYELPTSAMVKEVITDQDDNLHYKIEYEADGKMEICEYEDLI